MYKEQDEDVIFLETSYLQRRRHMFIECIPVPKEVGDVAPIYFKVSTPVLPPSLLLLLVLVLLCLAVFSDTGCLTCWRSQCGTLQFLMSNLLMEPELDIRIFTFQPAGGANAGRYGFPTNQIRLHTNV